MKGQKILSFFLVFLIFFLTFTQISPCSYEEKDSQCIAIKNVRVFDGERVIPEATVIIDSGRIRSLGKNISIPQGAKIIDGKGKTLLPGLIDSHVHVVYPNALEKAYQDSGAFWFQLDNVRVR